MVIIEIMLDSHSWVELEGRNARLYYMLHGVTHKSYDGLIRGLPESVVMELEELGAIKSTEDIKREQAHFDRTRKIIEAKRALRAI
jgi:uncharacterized protein YrrD